MAAHQQHAPPAVSSQLRQGSSTSMPQHTTTISSSSSDTQLFTTPADLVCPITLALLHDPVCNAAGQVYERSAIQRHLLQAAVSGQPPTDPVSNAVLPSLDLVPVWPMRSRAAEYRDATVRACVHAAASSDIADPVRYLRRAAELVLSGDAHNSSSGPSGGGGAAGPLPASCDTGQQQQQPGGLPTAVAAAPAGYAAAPAAAASIPGMTLDLAGYISAHQGSQYDALVLKYFGHAMIRGGCPDAASSVFYRLLLGADERAQQADYLQLCLDCWTCSSSGTEQQQQQQSSKQGVATTAGGGPAAAIISKLADFVQRQRCLSARAIVQMLESTHHGADMAMQLCQALLARAAAGGSGPATAGAEGGGDAAGAALGLPLPDVLELLLELVELKQGHMQRQVQLLAAQVQQLLQEAGTCADGTRYLSPTTGGSEAPAAAVTGQQQQRCRRAAHTWRGGKARGLFVGRLLRVAAAGTLAAASMASGNRPVLRVAHVGPLLYLLRCGL